MAKKKSPIKKTKKPKRPNRERKGLWQKNGKGIKYRSFFVWPEIRGKIIRVMVLVGFTKKGKADLKVAESPQMLKKQGWVRTHV